MMTLHEALQIGVESARLRATGKEKESLEMAKKRPMPPWMAKVFKDKMGLDFLLDMGWNMGDVEAAYGKEPTTQVRIGLPCRVKRQAPF
jgi:hypothetical protein